MTTLQQPEYSALNSENFARWLLFCRGSAGMWDVVLKSALLMKLNLRNGSAAGCEAAQPQRTALKIY